MELDHWLFRNKEVSLLAEQLLLIRALLIRSNQHLKDKLFVVIMLMFFTRFRLMRENIH